MNSNTKTILLGNLGKADFKTTASNSMVGQNNTAGGITRPNNCWNCG